MPNPTGAWSRMLVLRGDRVALWLSPTGRWFVGTPASHAHPAQPTGYTTAPEAIKAAANWEATQRRTPGQKLKLEHLRTVLWETQATRSYHEAERRVQLGLETALTGLNPQRAAYARLVPEERGTGR